MKYYITEKREVTTKEFVDANIRKILVALEVLEGMPNEDLIEHVAGGFSEVSDYVASLEEQILEVDKEFKEESDKDYWHQRLEALNIRGQ